MLAGRQRRGSDSESPQNSEQVRMPRNYARQGLSKSVVSHDRSCHHREVRISLAKSNDWR